MIGDLARRRMRDRRQTPARARLGRAGRPDPYRHLHYRRRHRRRRPRGVATGLLGAPCAGPILGLVLTGAAPRGASVQTLLLLLAYALGAATSPALALLVAGWVFAATKRGPGASTPLAHRSILAAVLG
jgi:hypothetical protein